jgi:hypothetical protein
MRAASIYQAVKVHPLQEGRVQVLKVLVHRLALDLLQVETT